MKLLSQTIKQLFTFIIAFQLAVPANLLAAVAKENAVSRPTPAQLRLSAMKAKISNAELENPLFGEFIKSLAQSDIVNNLVPSNIEADKDPFFLRSQKWTSGEISNKHFVDDVLDGYDFRKDEKSITIRVPGVQKHLTLNLPLTPIQETDDYIILSADLESTLFEDKVGDANLGEGFFFISTKELFQMAQSQSPVAIYFFPLPGNGWKGKIDSYDFNETNSLVLGNSNGEVLPIDTGDIAQVMHMEKLVRIMATVDTMMDFEEAGGGEPTSDIFNYPNPGTTAGFGMVGVSRQLRLSERVQKILESTASYILPKANASDGFDPAVMDQLYQYGKLISGILITAVLLKYTLLKKKLNKIRELESQARAEARRELAELKPEGYQKQLEKLKDPGKLNQYTRDVFTIFAHGTTVIAQLGSVTLGTAVELFTDRTLPEYAASEHKLLRKILNNTLLWSRKSASEVAVNWKTFYLGVVVMGLAVDTPFVYFQDFYIFPWFVALIAPFMPEAISIKMHTEFVASFESNKAALVQGVVRNGAAWAMNGASSYSAEAKAQLLPKVETDVDAELIRQGKNPKDSSVRKIRNEMIKDRIDKLSRQRGLPGNESFLFDLNTMINSAYKALGYTKKGEGDAVLEKRPLLAKNALRKAVRISEATVRENPTTDNIAVSDLLKNLLKDMNYLDFNLIKNPLEKFRRSREVRKTLTLLSFDGELNYELIDMDKSYKPLVARAAGLLFSRSLASYLSSEGDSEVQIPEDIFKRYIKSAHESIQKQVTGEAPEIDFEKWTRDSQLEYEMLLEEKIREFHAQDKKEEERRSFKPEEDDWLARRQKAKAQLLTMQQIETDEVAQKEFMTAATAEERAILTQNYREKWKKTYSYSLSKVLGLHIGKKTRETLLKSVHEQAEEKTAAQVEGMLGLKEYLEKLPAFERLKLEADIYAANFLDAYRDHTTQEVEKGPNDAKAWAQRMLLPDQPGFFQKVRQRDSVVNSKFKTRFLRWGDSWFDDEELKPGVKSWIKRNVPLTTDLINASIFFYRGFLTRAIASYTVFVYVFHLGWTWATFAWMMTLSPWLIYLPSNWLNRTFRQQGMKAMDTVRSKVFYGLLYSPATMWATIPFVLWYKDINVLVNEKIAPALGAMMSAVPDYAIATGAVVATLALSTRVREWVRSRFRHERQRDAGYNHGNPLVRHMNQNEMLSCRMLFGKP